MVSLASTRYLTPGTNLFVNQTNHFFNLGYGWLCKHCSAEKAEHHSDESRPVHFSLEERKHEPRMAALALARWTDATRHGLKCPCCGIEEMVNKA